jgi:hypothetical protein
MEQIELTASQRAKKKYYEKIKNTPEFIEKRNQNCNNYYHNKLKNNQEYKEKVSINKKEYYKKKKIEILLEIIV